MQTFDCAVTITNSLGRSRPSLYRYLPKLRWGANSLSYTYTIIINNYYDIVQIKKDPPVIINWITWHFDVLV